MEVRVYAEAESFWNDTSAGLRENEAKHSLIVGLARRFCARPDGCLYQSAAFKDGRFLTALTISRYLDQRNLLLAGEEAGAEPLVARAFADGANPTAVVAEVGLAQICREWLHARGRVTQTRFEQQIYRCRSLQMPANPEGLTLRQANLEDVPLLGAWTQAFLEEALPHEKGDGYAVAEGSIREGGLFVLGDRLAMAARARDIGTSCTVAMVYTPPNLRGRGYGSLVTALLTQKLLGEGRKETHLYTDRANPTSNKIYRAIGYEHVADSLMFGIH